MLELIIIRSHHHFEIEEIAQIGVENKIEMYFLKRVEVREEKVFLDIQETINTRAQLLIIHLE